MKSYCPYCDPKHFTIYGFCKNCKRKCECPFFDPKSNMSFSDYETYKKNWNQGRADLVLDAMRRTEHEPMGNPNQRMS